MTGSAERERALELAAWLRRLGEGAVTIASVQSAVEQGEKIIECAAALASAAAETEGLRGEVAHHFADELVERWNEAESGRSLAEWMGLTDEQYAMFVACDFAALAAALAVPQADTETGNG